MRDVEASPSGAVSLSGAIEALRSELMTAWVSSQDSRLRFRPSPVEVLLQVAVTSDKSAKAGVKWWLVEAGGEVSRQLASTHTVKLTLTPVFVDEQGQQIEFLISDIDDPAAPAGGDSSLDDVDD